MAQKPVIGINGDFRPSRKDAAALSWFNSGYYDSITTPISNRRSAWWMDWCSPVVRWISTRFAWASNRTRKRGRCPFAGKILIGGCAKWRLK
jgi:hypothetical protein